MTLEQSRVLQDIVSKRLLREILTADLLLKGDSPYRCEFDFLAGNQVIGLYSAASFAEKGLRLTRSWNRESLVHHPITGELVPMRGRQLDKIRSGGLLFLLEWDQERKRVVDKVAFTPQWVRYHREVRHLEEIFQGLKVEAVDLGEVQIIA